MLLNGVGVGSRSALRPRSSANDENAVVGGASSIGKGLAGLGAKTPGGGGGGGTNKPTVRLALGPAKSLDTNGPGGGPGVAKTPGQSHARRRAFGDISNRKAGRGPGHQHAAAAAGGGAAGGAGAKTPRAVSFQSNLFGPPTKTPGGGGGGKSAKKKGLQLQQRTPFASRNPSANPNANPNRSVSFEPSASSSTKLPSNAVIPMSSRKAKASSSSSSVVVPRTTSVVQDQIIDEDDGGGSVSSVELPAGGRVWDPSDFFGDDDDSYELAARIAAVNASLDDDPSFVMPTFPSKAAASVALAAGTDADDDRLLAKEMEELEKEDYETLDHLLNDFAPEDDHDGYGDEDDLLSGLTPSLDDHDDGLGLLDDLDDLALA